jgi:hypothetical protein
VGGDQTLELTLADGAQSGAGGFWRRCGRR